MRPPNPLLLVAVLFVAACSGAEDHLPAPAPAAERSGADAPERQRVEPALARHTQDGGWAPPEELLGRAAAMADPAVAAEVDALEPAERVSILRAGLRLSDGPAALACASQLDWSEIDGWECARVVDLLRPPYVLRAAPVDVYYRLCEILGSDDMPAFLDELPPLPWIDEPELLSQLHRMDREQNLPTVAAVAARSEESVAHALGGNLAVASGYSDGGREQLASFWLSHLPVHPDDADPPEDGLPRTLRRWLREDVFDLPKNERFNSIDTYAARWLRDCPPQPDADPADLSFRIAMARRARDDSWDWSTTLMLLQLGQLQDADTEVFLRQLVETDEDDVALLALARRGDPDALETATAWAADARDIGSDRATLATAVLWEVRPATVLESLRRVVSTGDGLLAAIERLRDAREMGEWYALTTPSTALAPLEQLAFECGDPVFQALVGAHIPGCGTRRLALAAARGIAAADPTVGYWMIRRIESMGGDLALGFLEIGAGDAFVRAVRRAALVEPEEEQVALYWLLNLDDSEFPPALLPRVMDVDFRSSYEVDGRRSPVLAAHYAALLRQAAPGAQAELAIRL